MGGPAPGPGRQEGICPGSVGLLDFGREGGQERSPGASAMGPGFESKLQFLGLGDS